MEKKSSRNRLVKVYRKQTTFQFHLFRHRTVLIKALDFASDYDNITTDERNIIIHAKSSEEPSPGGTITPLKHTLDSLKTTSRRDTETTPPQKLY